jgi:hypothetical protein
MRLTASARHAHPFLLSWRLSLPDGFPADAHPNKVSRCLDFEVASELFPAVPEQLERPSVIAGTPPSVPLPAPSCSTPVVV